MKESTVSQLQAHVSPMLALDQGVMQVLHQTAATTFFARENSAFRPSLQLLYSYEVFTELFPLNSACSWYQHRWFSLLKLKLRKKIRKTSKWVRQLYLESLLSAPDTSGEKPCAKTGRQREATGTMRYQLVPMAQLQPNVVFMNPPRVKTHGSSLMHKAPRD